MSTCVIDNDLHRCHHRTDTADRGVERKDLPFADGKIEIRLSVLREMFETIGREPPETGGMLGGDIETGQVTDFLFDDNPDGASRIHFTPDMENWNRVRNTEWKPRGVRAIGAAHSHPGRSNRPSGGDDIYALAILRAVSDLDYFLVFIINPEADGGRYALHTFVATAERDRLVLRPVEVIPVNENGQPVNANLKGDITRPFAERPSAAAAERVAVAEQDLIVRCLFALAEAAPKGRRTLSECLLELALVAEASERTAREKASERDAACRPVDTRCPHCGRRRGPAGRREEQDYATFE